ncbi:hypothetical protein V6N13_144689 [Hibiscus sabdariffa]
MILLCQRGLPYNFRKKNKLINLQLLFPICFPGFSVQQGLFIEMETAIVPVTMWYLFLLLIGNYFACVISLLAQDAVWAVGATVYKIWESAKFVKTSDAHEETFFQLKFLA